VCKGEKGRVYINLEERSQKFISLFLKETTLNITIIDFEPGL
jgi:hypothetical protein